MTRDQPAHAVPDHADVARIRGGERRGESSGGLGDAQAPVVVEAAHREVRRHQVQLQAQIGMQHHAERTNVRATLQRQLGERAGVEIGRVDPQQIRRVRRGTQHAELRAHDAGDEKRHVVGIHARA